MINPVPARPNVIGKADPAVDTALGYLHDRIRFVEVQTAHVDDYLTKQQADALYSAPVLRQQLQAGGAFFMNLSNLPGISTTAAYHKILSTTHTDTLVANVTRGDLIVGNATPLWARFAVGASQFYVRSNGTDPAWSALLASDLSGVVAVVNGGTGDATLAAHAVLIGEGTSAVALGGPGAVGTVLRGQGAAADPIFGAVVLTTDVTGILPYANGGTNASTAWTTGSLIFSGASAFGQDNANLFWDNTNKRFGLGTAVPVAQFEVNVASGAKFQVAGSDFPIGNTNPAFPRIWMGGTSASVTSVFNRINAATTIYFGETLDTGGYQFRGSGIAFFQGNVGIGTGLPNVGLDLATAMASRRLAVALVNGANADIAISTTGYMAITGPTLAFSVSGFANGFDGRILRVTSEVAQAMTITNLAGSLAANQIITGTGADVVLSAVQGATVHFVYNATLSKWCLVRST